MGLFVTSVIYTFGFFFDLGWLLVVCTYSYVFFYAISLGAIPFILVTEIFPTKGKSNGKKKQKRERERERERERKRKETKYIKTKLSHWHHLLH